LRFVVQKNAVVPPFISRGAPRQTVWNTSIS
jgi:hypothetical protein